MVILLSWLYGLSNDHSSGKKLTWYTCIIFQHFITSPFFTERPWWNQVFSIVCLCSSLNLHDHQGKLSRLPLVNHKITVEELHTLSKRLKLWAAHKRPIQLCIYFTHHKFRKASYDGPYRFIRHGIMLRDFFPMCKLDRHRQAFLFNLVSHKLLVSYSKCSKKRPSYNIDQGASWWHVMFKCHIKPQ